MMFRPSHVLVGALALTAAACSDNENFVQVSGVATVRLVNATDTPLTLSSNGVIDSNNVRLVFGQSSTCVRVDLTNIPTLVITNGGTGASIAFTPTLSAGDNVSVFAFGVTIGNVQFTSISNRFVPVTNSAGLRFFNGVASTGPLVMQRNASPVTPFVGFGTASGFVSVPIDSARITFSNRFNVVLDAGLMAFPMGQNSTVVVGPPAAGTNPLRFFTSQSC